MPTYAQLQTEPYWDREVVTEELDWLGDELCRRAGRPRAAFGSKGNNAHLRGAHRSQEWIRRSRYCTNRSYTVQSGLTAEQERHIAGADFTPGEWGSAENRRRMVEQTRRLVAALKSGRLVGVREVIGTLDGRSVVGTRPDGSTFSSDDSHLEHWHLTLDRRHCRDQQLMARILSIALGEPVEDEDMSERASQVIEAWARGNPKDESGTSVEPVLWRIRDETWQKRVEQKVDATLAAAKGVPGQAILDRIDQRAQEDAQRVAQLAEAAAQRDAELAELVRAGQSGELDMDTLLRRMGEVLTAGATAQQAS